MRNLPTIFVAFLASAFCLLPAANASILFLTGTITQSPADLGVTPAYNPSLVSVADGDSFKVTLGFSGGLASPGNYALTSILFQDTTAGVSESTFVSGTMTVQQSGALSQFSVFGCLPTDCLLGNSISLMFQIPTASLLGTGIAVQNIPLQKPFELLEDFGSTDILGNLSSYSYTAQSGVPEPASFALALSGIAVGMLSRRIRK